MTSSRARVDISVRVIKGLSAIGLIFPLDNRPNISVNLDICMVGDVYCDRMSRCWA